MTALAGSGFRVTPANPRTLAAIPVKVADLIEKTPPRTHCSTPFFALASPNGDASRLKWVEHS
jgi:hypothetical protein